MTLKMGWREYSIPTLLIGVVLAAPTGAGQVSDSHNDPVKKAYREYVRLMNHQPSLDELASHWNLATLQDGSGMNESDQKQELAQLEYALRYPAVFSTPPERATTRQLDPDTYCLMALGQAADGNGHVAVHVLFRDSENGWQHSDVHAQFLNNIPAPSSPDCSFAGRRSP